jgi:hypothetical protein
MSYTLQAIIMKNPQESDLIKAGLRSVVLSEDLYIVPLPYDYVESQNLGFLPLTDEGLNTLPESLQDLCMNFSRNAKAIYAEAEFFGGAGTQASALFENGCLVEAPKVDESAINYALLWLDASKNKSEDQFSVVGLGRHRNAEGWLNA